jgi:fermentation-respiration switch protein FrsA (DUF1100 family)
MPKRLIEVIKALLVVYITIVLVFVVLQRTLIYSPTPAGPNTPAQFSVPYQDVTITASDETKLAGWWLNHEGLEPRPVLIYCHGNGATLSSLAHVAAMFYKFGWDALLIDYRHYGNSQDGPSGLTEQGVHRDVQAGYDWLKARGVLEKNIIVWGHSLGSSFAAWLASNNHPAGLVLEGSFPSAYAMARYRYPWLLIPKFLIWDKLETGLYVTRRNFPLLVIHAENDTIIPLELGQEVFELASKPKEFLLVPGIDHNDLPSVIDRYKEHLIGLARSWIK